MVLEVKNLTKTFAGFTAVDNVSFSLKAGEILGFLGPNGAGKTTTIQMLLGILRQTAGEILYFGKKLADHRSEILEQVNFSSTYTNLPWDLTVRECLTFTAYLYDIENRKKRIQEMVEIFKLTELVDHTVSKLSAGQVTRLNLAKAFINNPQVLLLDEPTASLDPDVANYIRQFLLEERKKFNISIVFTSHNMSEVEELCDRVIFINHGKIVADDTPESLARSIEVCRIRLLGRQLQKPLMEFCRKRKLVCNLDGRYLVVEVKEKAIAKFLQDLSAAGLEYEEVSIEKPTLEDYFIQHSIIS